MAFPSPTEEVSGKPGISRFPLLCSVSSGVGFIKIRTKKRTGQHPGVLNHGPREFVSPPKKILSPHGNVFVPCSETTHLSRLQVSDAVSSPGLPLWALSPQLRVPYLAHLAISGPYVLDLNAHLIGEYTTREQTHPGVPFQRDCRRRFALTLHTDGSTAVLGAIQGCQCYSGLSPQMALSSALRSHGRNT